MSMSNINRNSIQNYQDRIARLRKAYLTDIDRFSTVKQTFEEFDYGSRLKKAQESLYASGQKLTELEQGFVLLLQELDVAQERARENGDQEVEEDTYGYADAVYDGERTEVEEFNPETYGCYNVAMSGFRADLTDVSSYVGNFMNSGYATLLATAELSNYPLYVEAFANPNQYTDQLLKGALDSILSSLADAGPVPVEKIPSEIKDILSYITKFSGNLAEILPMLINGILSAEEKKKLGAQKTAEAERLLELFSKLPKDKRKKLASFFQILNQSSQGIEKVIKYANGGVDILERLFTDYSAQLGYLDSLENALNLSAANGGNVKQVLTQLRSEYNNCVVKYIADNQDKWVQKATEKAIEVCAPPLSAASKTLAAAAGLVKDLEGNAIAASNSLYGLMQYDQILSRSYNQYAEMIQNKMATQEDIENAEKIYLLMKQTKKTAYEKMLILEKEKEKFQQFGYTSDYSEAALKMAKLKYDDLDTLENFLVNSANYQ